jgi:hydrogenase/urease accessory protein HupE
MPAAALAFVVSVLAHNPDTSYVRVKIEPGSVETRLTYDVFTLLKITPLDDNRDGQLQRGELTAHAPQIAEFLRSKIGLAVSEDDESADLGEFTGFMWPPDVGEAIAGIDFHSANGLIHFNFVREIDFTPEEVAIAFGFFDTFTDRHTVLGVFSFQGKEEEATFTNYEPDYTYLTGQETPLWHRLKKFFQMGVEHIFLGYDHICFLIALIVVSRFREIVKIVTSFTIAHSITLILATLDVVRLPTRLIETCIAATVVYVAVENLWIKDTRHRWWLTFFFGLVHGFGFANVLREMGLPTVGLIRCLLSFNLGVECGQLCIAICLLPLAYALNHWKYGRSVAMGISILLALFGTAWFVDRLFALDLMQRFGL